MSRFFKYKDAEALAAAARALELDVRLSADLSPLAQAVRVGGRTVGNRLAIQPMEGCDGTLDGTPDELTFRRYDRFGAGGAKLIWGEAAAVVPEGRANSRQLVIDNSRASALEQLLARCRAAHRAAWGDDRDLLVGLQLTHSGRYSRPCPIPAQSDPLLDRPAEAGVRTSLITDDELDRLQDCYVASAALAFKIGFDFIDLKQCHRYLLNELLAARMRLGRYGGSFENRTRFGREVVARIREACPEALIATRLNVFDGIPYRRGEDGNGVPVDFRTPVQTTWGTNVDDPFTPDLAEPLAYIGLLSELGVALVNVSIGNPYASPHLLRPFEYAPVDGYASPEHPLVGVARHFRLTAAVQEAYPDLAVVGSGYSWLQAYLFQAGAANVRDGRATFVGVGRASLAQPDFGRHVLLGEPLDPRRTCRTFSYCTALMRAKKNELGQFATGCPPFDKEVYGPIWEQAKRSDQAVGETR